MYIPESWDLKNPLKVKLTKVILSFCPVRYSWEFLVRVWRLVVQILTLLQTKNVIFHTRLQIWPLINYVIIIIIT